jgi:hypothetical protein
MTVTDAAGSKEADASMRFIVWVEERGVCFDRTEVKDQSGSGSAAGVAWVSTRDVIEALASRTSRREITPPDLPLPVTNTPNSSLTTALQHLC